MVTEAHCGLLEHLTDSYKLPINFKGGPALNKCAEYDLPRPCKLKQLSSPEDLPWNDKIVFNKCVH